MHKAKLEFLGYKIFDESKFYVSRNPDTSNRASFSSILSSLSSPDKQLLITNEEPATVLGGALETSQALYTDLQYMYKK